MSTHEAPAWQSGRLFDTGAPTDHERTELRRRNRAGQLELPSMPAELEPRPCPACSGTADGCTCSRTGATALELEWITRPDVPPFRIIDRYQDATRVELERCAVTITNDGRVSWSSNWLRVPGDWPTVHAGPRTYGHADIYAPLSLRAAIAEERAR